MTVLPTVRRQLQQAAELRATSRSGRVRSRISRIHGGRSRTIRPASGARPASSRSRAPVSLGGAVAAFSVIVALGIAILALAVLGHRRIAATSPATRLADRYRLSGVGIGEITFGQGPQAVAAGLERLLGRPASAGTAGSIGYVRSICGFDHEIDWTLAASPKARSDELTVYFKPSRFVGYSYGAYAGPQAPVVRHGPMLSTTEGLGLDDTLARGRQLYGLAFIVTTQAQGTPPSKRLQRLPAWEAQTANGRIYGFIDSPGGPHTTQRRTIGIDQRRCHTQHAMPLTHCFGFDEGGGEARRGEFFTAATGAECRRSRHR